MLCCMKNIFFNYGDHCKHRKVRNVKQISCNSSWDWLILNIFLFFNGYPCRRQICYSFKTVHWVDWRTLESEEKEIMYMFCWFKLHCTLAILFNTV